MKRLFTSFFILLTASGLYGQTTYNGSDLTVEGSVVSVSQLNITDSGTITDIDIKITTSMSAYQAYEYLNLSLISPSGTSVKLIKKGSLKNDAYQMILTDETLQGISDGSPPYSKNTRPDNPLYHFDGESISGNWELVVSNLQGFNGTVQWSLSIMTDSSTPLSAPNFGTEYAGSQILIAGSSTTVGNLTIPGDITITDLNIKLTVNMSAYQGFEYIRLLLKSDQITYYPFTEKHFSGNMYKTIIDDEAIQKTTTSIDWSSPHIGPHQSPNGPLDSFDGLKASNDWELIVTNSQGFNGTLDWSLLVNSPLERPTVSISTSESSPTDNLSIPVTITFSEYVNDFEMSDISVSNGYFSEMNGTGTTYDGLVSPTTLSGNISIDIAENVAVSKANYGNQAATQLGIVYRKELNAPAAPTGLSTKYGNKKIKLTWSKNSESDVAKYYIYQGVSSNPTTLVDSTLRNDDTTKVFTDLTNGQAYYYRVKAIDNYGNISDYSSSISTTPNPEILTVKKDGTGNYTTIKDAATNAIEGDTILIYEGNYQESNILNTEKNLTFASEYILDNDTTHISKTVISASTKSTLAIQTYSNCEIKGLTFNSGYFRIGGKVSHSTFNETGHLRLIDKAEIISCRFYDAGKNSSSDEGRGGAIYAVSSDSIRIVNSLFVCNIDLAYSNHIYFENVKGVEIINSTFISTKDKPAIYYHQNNTTGKIINSIFKQSHRAFLVPTGTPSEKFQVYNSLFDIGNGEIVDNNLYINLNSTLSASSLLNDDFSLSDYSPAIGGGTKSHAPSDDILGNPRPSPAGSFPDLGAFENSRSEPLPHNTKIYVSKDGNDTGSFGLENSPFLTIDAALTYAKDNDTIYVNAGTYNETLLTWDHTNLLFKSVAGANSTIIDAQNKTLNVIRITGSGTFDGFTITNSNASNSGVIDYVEQVSNTPLKIINCRLINNLGQDGVIKSNDGEIEIVDSYFSGNGSKTTSWGVISIGSAYGAKITNCTFENNNSNSSTIVIASWQNNAYCEIINSKFINETKDANRSSIHIRDSGSPAVIKISGCLFYKGSGMQIDSGDNGGDLLVSNTRFSRNTHKKSHGYTLLRTRKAEFNSCVFDSNRIEETGLIKSHGNNSTDSLTIVNSVFINNEFQVVNNSFIDSDQGAKFVSNIFYNNTFDKYRPDGGYFETLIDSSISGNFDYSFVDFEIGIPANFQTRKNITGHPFFCADDTTYSKVGNNSPLLGKGKDGVNIGGVNHSCDAVVLTDYLSPSNGDTLYIGKRVPIIWDMDSVMFISTVEVLGSYDGLTFTTLGTGTDSGSVNWDIENFPSNAGKIKLKAIDINAYKYTILIPVVIEPNYPMVSIITPLSNSVLKIGDINTITWTTNPDNIEWPPLVENVDIYYSIDNGSNWKEIVKGNSDSGSYKWIIPDDPSDNVLLRLIVKEQYGYADTAEVQNLEIQIAYPTFISIDPAEEYLWSTVDTLTFRLNVAPDPATIIKSNIGVTNLLDDYQYDVSSIDKDVYVIFEKGLYTKDEITITFDSKNITSFFGYKLDGNGDGSPGDDYIVDKKVHLPIDYNYDKIINTQDVSLFVDYFKSNDLKWETAPIVAGTVPYVKILPDGKYDIDDMLTFVQFGNWYLQGASGKVADDIGNTPISLDTTIQSKDYTVSFSKSTKAIEVYVKYDPLKLTPIIEPTSGEIKLGHHDTEKGIISLIVYNPSDESIRLKWNQLDKKSESDISVLVKTTDQNGQETVKRTMLKVISVPSEFALHDNYPNPFNPTTTFRFDVPEVSDVTLSIYNMLGQRVRTFNYQNTSAGYHSVTWDATNDLGEQVGAGVYLYQLRAKQFVKTRKMVLLK
jgi:hypothetical protein